MANNLSLYGLSYKVKSAKLLTNYFLEFGMALAYIRVKFGGNHVKLSHKQKSSHLL